MFEVYNDITGERLYMGSKEQCLLFSHEYNDPLWDDILSREGYAYIVDPSKEPW